MMAFPLIPFLGAVTTIIEKIIPDPQKAAEAKIKMFELAQQGELAGLEANLKIALAQVEVNKEEAKAGPYRGGWRPFIGWTCGVAFGYTYVLQPLLMFVIYTFGDAALIKQMEGLPKLDIAYMMPVLMGMLGLAGMRSFEKTKGQS